MTQMPINNTVSKTTWSKNVWAIQLFLLLAGYFATASIYASQIEGIRLAPSNDHTRMVIELAESVEHRLMTLSSPERLVVDLQKTSLPSGLKFPNGSGVISRIRSGIQDGRLRLVADLKSEVKAKSYFIPAEGRKKPRLVIDLFHQSEQPDLVEPVKTSPHTVRDLVIAIDAGHGGIDPGSIGKHGTQEKLVVMQIAQRLANKINSAEGMRAYMVRDNDKKIQYRERMDRARKQDADLFVSIHADSYSDSSVAGSSVYVLSQRGASSTAARWLANKVNSADLVGGVSLNDKDDMLASVLLDLSQNASIAASTSLGKSVISELSAIGRIRKNTVQYANFAVLKSPDIPSILVETAYISNPDEEKKLKNPQHQERIAGALFKGVNRYFSNNPPPDSLFAQQRKQKEMPVYRNPETVQAKIVDKEPVQPLRVAANAQIQSEAKVTKSATVMTEQEYELIRHTIRQGETLSAVSRRYNVTLRAIKSINNLTRDSVRIGQVLQIPVI